MRWVILCLTGLFFIAANPAAQAAHDADVYLYGPAFQVAGLKFTIPSKWQSVPADNPARVGQWRVPQPHGLPGESGEVVVFYFGKGVGGSAKETIDGWAGTILNPDGHPASAEVKQLDVAGIKISQAAMFGTYLQNIPLPGIPPAPKPNHGLLGAVVEGPQGTLYWRFTGPEPLITANVPLFNKIIASVKLQQP